MSASSVGSGPSEVEAGASPQETKWLALIFGGLILVYLGLILTFELGVKPGTPEMFKGANFTPMRMDAYLGGCAFIGFVGLVAWGLLRRYAFMHSVAMRRVTSGALVALVVAATLISFYGRKVQRTSFTQMWDTYHYALGPKYFSEMSYFGLYDCTAEVLGMRSFRKKKERAVKDLLTYGKITGKESIERHCLDESFDDPERRAEFVRDIELFIELESRARVKGMLKDHGYNGAPFHATFSGFLANLFEMTPNSLPMLASIDGVALLIMLFVIARFYGWRAGLVFALFFLTHIIDRNKSIGASFIRYSWMVSLGIGIACLHGKKMGWGAFFLVAASMLNVFPLLFGLGVVARGVADWVKERSLRDDFKRFLVVGALASAGIGLSASMSGRGLVGSYQEFFEDMRIHSEGPPGKNGVRRERIPGYGIGLKFTFMYRGDHHKGVKRFSVLKKSRQYREIKHYAQGLGVLMTLLALGIATRLAYAEAAILVGFTTFYCLLGTVAYYFTCASLVWLLWHQRRRRPGAYLMALGFWLISLLGYACWLKTKFDPLLFGTVMSYGWFFYIWATLIYLGWDTGLLGDLVAKIAAPSAATDELAPDGNSNT